MQKEGNLCLVSRERNRYNTGKGDEIPVELRKIAEYIGLELPKVWQGEEAQRIADAYKADWLEQYDFEEILHWYGVEEQYSGKVLEEVRRLKEEPILNQACFAMYHSLFFTESCLHQTIWDWEGILADYMICVVAVLCGQPIHQRNMEKRGFSEEQVRLHKEEIRNSFYSERDVYGIEGIRFTLMIWCSIFMRGEIISCGRLQYELGTCVAERILPHVEKGSVCAYIHIPGGKKLAKEAVLASLQQAKEDVVRYYPETKGAKLVFCTQTWLLSPEIRELLPVESNVLQFQKLFRIVDTIPGNGPFLNFLFRAPGETHYERLPEDTFLRRQVKKCLLEGKTLQMGVGIVKE